MSQIRIIKNLLISWGKVIFSEVSVILFMGKGGLCMMSLPVWLPGPMVLLGVSVSGPMFLPRWSLSLVGLCPWSHVLFRGSLSKEVSVQGVSVQGVSVQRFSVQWGLYMETPRIRKAGGMHRTGMLSCFVYICCLNTWVRN